MSQESSVIARKLRNIYQVESAQPTVGRVAHQERVKAESAGILKNLALISLTALACLSTKVTLFLVRLSKKIEG